ncbi:MAG: urease accessory protein UreH [Deltaproteobacteria bacterium]|nr:MAG: urease accessory protein UreH [Deltaproteobacteria bacterium]
MPHSALGLLAFGFVLGLRHALDVDHLAAVSTIVTSRRSLWASSIVGAVWGLGHTAALLAVALVVVGLHAQIPPRLGAGLELAVAAMLVGLGLNLLGTLWRGGRLHFHGHAHDGREHLHPHVHPRTQRDATQHHPVRAARRPFVVGLVHGLAGSAALMLGVLATIPSPRLALAYVATFGGGSIGGMIAMSTLLGMPLALAAERFARAELVLRACAAVGSVAVGVLLALATGLPR